MNTLKNFFIFCSGVHPSILKRTPSETNKYVGIGGAVFFTGVFASIAAGFALSTIFKNYWVIIPISVVWGLMIFNLDRFIVSTLKRRGKFMKDSISAFPRIVLAILVAIVISKPLELKIFQSEIESELVLMEQENYRSQDNLVKNRYQNDIDKLGTEISDLRNAMDAKQKERDMLYNEANAEADGTGGSKRRNLGPIYRAKKEAADVVQSELDILNSQNQQLIALFH